MDSYSLLPPLEVLHDLRSPFRATRLTITRHIKQDNLRLAALRAPYAECIHLPRSSRLRRRPAHLFTHNRIQQ